MLRGPYKRKDGKEKLYPEARRLRLEEKMSYREISDLLEVNYRTIANWLNDIPLSKEDRTQVHLDAMKKRRLPLEALRSKEAIRNRLIEIRGHRCEECGRRTWNGKIIALETHRKTGKEYSEQNCDLLCPNCHSLTPTWRKSWKNYARA